MNMVYTKWKKGIVHRLQTVFSRHFQFHPCIWGKHWMGVHSQLHTHILGQSSAAFLSMVRLIRMRGRKLIWSRSLQLIHVPIQTKEFRGISATSVTARTFERTVHSTFSKQNFERYIRNDQFAYRMGGSCTNALLRISMISTRPP